VKHEFFGYVLHLADIATNKALAAAGRREPRDILDLLLIHERYLPLGAVAWAAIAKDSGFTPRGCSRRFAATDATSRQTMTAFAAKQSSTSPRSVARFVKRWRKPPLSCARCPPARKACSFSRMDSSCSPTLRFSADMWSTGRAAGATGPAPPRSPASCCGR